MLSGDFTIETGMHGYRDYQFPQASVFRSDNRSSYKGLGLKLQGNVTRVVRISMPSTRSPKRKPGAAFLASFSITSMASAIRRMLLRTGIMARPAKTSRNRFVLGGHVSGSAGFRIRHAFPGGKRATDHSDHSGRHPRGREWCRDHARRVARHPPYIQMDLRVSRPIHVHDRFVDHALRGILQPVQPQQSRRDYVTDISALPIPSTISTMPPRFALLPLAMCHHQPDQLRVPARRLAISSAPAHIGIPFAAQLGIKLLLANPKVSVRFCVI